MEEENPFRKSNSVLRSPILIHPEPANCDTVAKEIANPQEEINAENVGRNRQEASKFSKMGEKISKLVGFLKGRTNVHKEIHSMVREIQVAYMRISDEGLQQGTPQIKTTAEKGTCTDAVIQPRVRRVIAVEQGTTPKRRAADLSPNGNRTKKNKKEESSSPSKNREEAEKPAEQREKTRSDKWQKVGKKGRPTIPKQRPTRPDALVIAAKEGKSYSDILRCVKADEKLSALGKDVATIRKTRKGELLIELCKTEHQNVEDYRNAVKAALGETADVRSLKQEIFLEIKDLDEITTREDVHEALVNLTEETKGLQISAVKSVRRSYGGTQTATIGVSTETAKKLMEVRKIKIGWTICRIRQKLPRKCFKCLEYGHNAANCKSKADYSKCCLKCGVNGHKMRDCAIKKPTCLICSGDESSRNHLTGSSYCPKYKKALERQTFRL